MTTAYLESSALVKLAIDERETVALRAALDSAEHQVTSELALVEVARGVGRREGDPGRARARGVLLRVLLRPIDRPILERAAQLDPATLRSLDAIHVATALTLDTADVVFYAYDRRTLEAAVANGLTVASPGA